MYILCPPWSSIYRKLNDSATVALIWHMLSLYWIEVLDRRFLKNSHSTVKQNSHRSKMFMVIRNHSMKWTLRHPVVQRLRSWWDTHRFKSQPSMKDSEDSNLTSSMRKLTKHNYPPLDFFFIWCSLKLSMNSFPNKFLLKAELHTYNFSYVYHHFLFKIGLIHSPSI